METTKMPCKQCGEEFTPVSEKGTLCPICTMIAGKVEQGSEAWKLIQNTISKLGLAKEKKAPAKKAKK